jgi:hypothetical protein
MKNYLKNFLLIVAALTVALVLLEAVFAIVDLPQPPVSYFQTCQLKAYQRGDFLGYYPSQECYQCYFRNDELDYYDKTIEMDGNRFGCIRYRIGTEGYRTPTFKEEHDGPRIVVIGDSFTFGEGVKEKDTFPRLLQESLGIETINLSMQGLNTRYERRNLQENMHLKPDLVIVGYVLNDTMPHQETIRMLGDNIKKTTQVPKVISLSRACSFAYMRISSFFQSRKTLRSYHYWFEKGWPESRKELLAIKYLCNNHGAELLVVLFPILYWVDGRYPFLELHQQIRKFAEESEIGFVDLLDVYKKKKPSDLRVHPVDHHPNAVAHKIASNVIHRWITEKTNMGVVPKGMNN